MMSFAEEHVLKIFVGAATVLFIVGGWFAYYLGREVDKALYGIRDAMNRRMDNVMSESEVRK